MRVAEYLVRVPGYFHIFLKLEDFTFLHTACNMTKTHPKLQSTPMAANLSNT